LVVVEFETLNSSGVGEKRQYLSELLSDGAINRLWYLDSGPPPNAFTTNRHGTDFVEDWLVLDVNENTRDAGATYVIGKREKEKKYHNTLVIVGNYLDSPSGWEIPKSYGLQSTAWSRMRQDILAALGAESIKADIYITDRESLFLSRNARLFKNLAICSPEDAIQIVGLYLREQGEYRISETFSVSRNQLFSIVTQELLPEYWRWINACSQHSFSVDDDEAVELALSTITRINRAIRIRDRFSMAMNRPQTIDTSEEILLAVDLILVHLMAALDAAASVAHYALGLMPDDARYAGWQNEKWKAKLSTDSGELLSEVARFNNRTKLLNVLPPLRNSIHSQAIRAVAFVEQAEPVDVKLLVKRDVNRIFKHLDESLSLDWGLELSLSNPPDQLVFDPTQMLDHAIDLTLEFLNLVMKHTPVEHMSGVALIDEDRKRPKTDIFGIGDFAQRTLWQFGFE
jgi:hypothetical protein